MNRHNLKANHRKEHPKDQPMSARLSVAAKQGLKAKAEKEGVSLNEYLEQLGLSSLPPTSEASLSGGVLGLLIQDAEDRLAEVYECIAWYERVRDREAKHLAALKSLSPLPSSLSDSVSEGSEDL